MRSPIEYNSTQLDRVLVARIDPGEDLQKSIETLAEKKHISAGVILSVVGSLSKAKLRNIKRFPSKFPVSDTDRVYDSIEGPIEILNVSGNICRRKDNVTHVHLHMTISKTVDEEVVIIGGHVSEGCETYVMVEVFIGILEEGSFTREMHPERKSWEIRLAN